jgi:hypothetical protein
LTDAAVIGIKAYAQLLKAIDDAQTALDSAAVGFDADRQEVLRLAREELQATIKSLAVPTPTYD